MPGISEHAPFPRYGAGPRGRQIRRMESSPEEEIPPELLVEYRRAVATQVTAIKACADRLAKYPSDRDALETFRREVHKVRGSAGSYGFPDASDLAAGMEETAKDWIQNAEDVQLDRGALARWFMERITDFIKPPPESAAAAVANAVGRSGVPRGHQH